ncbi:cysteine desulfurase family protein [Sphingomonas sp. HMP9]|uniref:cysteine desulfurase family protein n=1 Tax=Sphingomonas sp. HMP9 TaxID=1517554 RepID=UPI001596A13F|nr:aminotransferase class V-fold PLP-dependent enzyme [Sphingomonas sp. HMP9]
MRPEAIAAVMEGMARWANPSSPHAEGREARRALEDARARIKSVLGWTGEVILTSGASEALAIGLGRSKAVRQLVSAVEHDAVFRAAPRADILPIIDGQPDEVFLAEYLDTGAPPVVAIQSINSETGTALLPYVRSPTLKMVQDAGGLVLADCSQSAGKMPLPDADMVVVSAHKLGGPPGVGALFVRNFGMLEPTGGHESGYRAGTENLPGVLGFAAALDVVSSWSTDVEQRFDFKNSLHEVAEINMPGVQCSHIFSVAMEHLPSAAQLIRLDGMGFSVSAGSACSSGTLKTSRSLAAFGVSDVAAARTIRISLGWSTTVEELNQFARAFRTLAHDAAARAA